MEQSTSNLGILVGGGPAPGINGVIASAVIQAGEEKKRIYGFKEGYKWLARGDLDLLNANTIEFSIRDVSRIHFDGGSVLGTSRTNPLKTDDGVPNTLKMLKEKGIGYMITIGGDDTAFAASKIAEEAKRQNIDIRFAHVPKTIDNDLPLPRNIPTFGFQTARHVGSDMIKNLMQDAKTANRWYMVVAMGRHSGHLALGMAKSAAATLCIIPEQFDKEKPISVNEVCDIFESSIIKRRAMGAQHGIVVIAEGVAERLDPEELANIPGTSVERDSFGNLSLAEIDLGKIIKWEIERRFKEQGEKFRLVTIDIGYILRSADPVPFDQEYTRDLGYSAVYYLLSNKEEYRDNAMICIDGGELHPIKFEDIINPETGKTDIRMVDVNSHAYRVANEYMIRLRKRDIEDKEYLEILAKAGKMTSEEFLKRFAYLAQ
jgi:6-phosphofructokinase 1